MKKKRKKFPSKTGMEKKVIFSVFRAEKDEKHNLLMHVSTKHELKQLGIRAIEVEGYYNGQRELSFVVSDIHLEYVLAVAKKAEQECVLHVLEDSTCRMLDTDNKRLWEGTCMRVIRGVAETYADYTHYPEEDAYWVCL